MPTVSGRVVFNRNGNTTINAENSGLANIPIVLQNMTTDARLVVLTDSNGNYSFENVPNGNYKIAKSYGITESIPTSRDFSSATNTLNNLDYVTSSTILVTVSGEDVFDQNFVDKIKNNYTIKSNVLPLNTLDPADVSIIKTASPSPVNAGDILTYTIQVSNAGPDDAENVIVRTLFRQKF
ncbi:SdrD B-like domain-containing protein [Proteiniborus sp. MB09-C3]|uniref:SdrD B-like domain-containing protein n=1 Tax=Proteiniborus sp. MB09-C3 TaxID=3050072 RepID=UPI00255473E8|nr:SdrD B-like domain-containing protein [Proteiniborus sp. MB09-C3]WIV12927.1 SdrD B-like domain-containing protein [Proteiniborus sp. MB09-C3]